ncbi:ABC transporter substrate-binding protein [Wenzhouxiangella sp. XN24]|uniref:MlaC/ttg2D family ABC transporter substrate-binding protein n=1 Tax=Wenzhouxiangella sp. XN24 TaxID=2713569 RepID=UPI0013ECD8E8|nr:ABC transporter substrate-binding protein [Wenzhouxiangella sp. XN24]NGX15446.1 ABC transporter substrate-binding protein [Wenzhouxiangella sp. XN24]
MNVRMMRMRIAVAMLAIGAVTAAAASHAQEAPERTPEQVIRDASDLTMEAIEGRREELAKDAEALFAIVDEVLLPRWDRQYTGQLVMGRYWREATPEQREEFITALYRKLLGSYGDGILEYEADQLRITGTRGDPAEGRVMVDSEVRLEDGTPVPISYRLRLVDNRWLLYDVVVEGISYVTNYRNQYASEFRAKGVEGVIEELRAELESGDS